MSNTNVSIPDGDVYQDTLPENITPCPTTIWERIVQEQTTRSLLNNPAGHQSASKATSEDRNQAEISRIAIQNCKFAVR